MLIILIIQHHHQLIIVWKCLRLPTSVKQPHILLMQFWDWELRLQQPLWHRNICLRGQHNLLFFIAHIQVWKIISILAQGWHAKSWSVPHFLSALHIAFFWWKNIYFKLFSFLEISIFVKLCRAPCEWGSETR